MVLLRPSNSYVLFILIHLFECSSANNADHYQSPHRAPSGPGRNCLLCNANNTDPRKIARHLFCVCFGLGPLKTTLIPEDQWSCNAHLISGPHISIKYTKHGEKKQCQRRRSLKMVDERTDRRRTDGRLLDGYTISSPCEPYGSGELKIINIFISANNVKPGLTPPLAISVQGLYWSPCSACFLRQSIYNRAR